MLGQIFVLKKETGEKLLHINLLRSDLSGADSLPRGQGPEDSKAGASTSFPGSLLGTLIIPLLITHLLRSYGPGLMPNNSHALPHSMSKTTYEVDLIINHFIDEQNWRCKEVKDLRKSHC